MNWTRSRVRRQHLIALGIPVNLDEVLPHAGGKPMPALQITTRPMSAPPGARPGHHANGSASAGGSRRGSPAPRGPAERLGLGPKPSIDEPKIEHLLSLKYGALSISLYLKFQWCLYSRFRPIIASSSPTAREASCGHACADGRYIFLTYIYPTNPRRSTARLGDVQQTDRRAYW